MAHALIPQITERRGVAVASSLDVAAFFGKRHDNVLQRIRGLLKTEDTPRDWFVERIVVDQQNGESYPVFDMTRAGFTLLAVGFTGQRAHRFKVAYIQRFDAMEAALAERRSPAVIERRADGKITRRSETDVIQIFVKYAIAQGSTNAGRYYRNLTDAAYRALGLLELGLKSKGLRDKLNLHGLAAVQMADHIVEKALRDGMDEGLHYKAIYQLAKERLEVFASVTAAGASLVPPAYLPGAAQ